jgi:uncharacterized protein with HEPN domain
MKLLASKKAILSILGVSSVVLASTYRDMKSESALQTKLADEKDNDISLERSVASEEAPSKVAQIFLPMNEENIKKINTSWEISRIVDSSEKVVFDKFQNQEDSKKSIKVKMELIGNGIVRLDKDNEQVYRVSILTDFGTIAIFKKMGNGYEIIEAKKVVKVVENKIDIQEEETDLVLERALNQAKGNKILTGADVSGQMTLNKGTISNFSVTLHNQNGEEQSVEIDSADIMDGGAFKADVSGEEISGVLFNNGKEGFRVSFVTGPMAGAMLNFVTKSQYEEIQERDAVSERDQLDQGKEEVVEAQSPVIEERQVAAENLPAEQKLSVEEIKETAEQNGFAF